MKKFIYLYLFLIWMLALGSCKKSFLDERPSKSLLVPTTLADFQALLDNLSVMNMVPGIERIGTDDLYTNDDGWQYYSSADQRNSYIWAKDIYEGSPSQDWNIPYQAVFYANVVLDGLKKLSPSDSPADYNRIKGSALFYRAFAYYNLAQLFAKQYNAATASKDPGLPIRTTSDVNLRPSRGTVQDLYNQMLSDLNTALSLLPRTPTVKSRPSKASTLALLSRLYLTIGDYQNTQTSAATCLQIQSSLLDYSKLDTTSAYPFPADLPSGNDEVIFDATSLNYDFVYSSETGVDTTVLRSYVKNDLRRPLIFYFASAPFVSFNGGYNAEGIFAGLATDEVYLNNAEALARLNKVAEALNALNTLLVKRFEPGTYIPYTAANSTDALKIVLAERRKEMFTNQGIMRWVDLRRLNLDPRFAVTLKHIIKGTTYALPPNDPRYVYPIPDNEIQNDNIAQNPR